MRAREATKASSEDFKAEKIEICWTRRRLSTARNAWTVEGEEPTSGLREERGILAHDSTKIPGPSPNDLASPSAKVRWRTKIKAAYNRNPWNLRSAAQPPSRWTCRSSPAPAAMASVPGGLGSQRLRPVALPPKICFANLSWGVRHVLWRTSPAFAEFAFIGPASTMPQKAVSGQMDDQKLKNQNGSTLYP